MVDANVGSLLVTEEGEIAGIITERDYLRRVTLQGRTDKETAVREIMSSPLVVATPETLIDECMAMMTDRRIRHLPVVDDGAVVGVVSIGDPVPGQGAGLRDQVPDRLHHWRTPSRLVRVERLPVLDAVALGIGEPPGSRTRDPRPCRRRRRRCAELGEHRVEVADGEVDMCSFSRGQ